MQTLKSSIEFAKRQYLAWLLLGLLLVFSLVEPTLVSGGTLRTILGQAGFTGLAALGMMFLIAEGSLDLSVPGVVSLSALAIAVALPFMSAPLAMLVGMLVGLLAGLVNGILVAYVEIPAFIATLGTQYLYLGVVFVLTGGGVVPLRSPLYARITNASVGIFPLSFIVLVVLAVLAFGLLYFTRFGRSVRAIGSNAAAASLAGIPVRRVQLWTFALGGVLFAVAGIFLSGMLSSASGTMATGFELNVIAAVVVGGTPLRGGRATVFGTVLGAVLFSALASSLNILGVGSYWQYVVTGTVLAVAVSVGAFRGGVGDVRGAD